MPLSERNASLLASYTASVGIITEGNKKERSDAFDSFDYLIYLYSRGGAPTGI